MSAWRRPPAGGVALALPLALVIGCGGGSSATSDGGVGFIAENVDFKDYSSWTSVSLDDPNPGGSTHVAGERTIYINHEPPAGATEFPVGTILVKVTAADGKIFARAKRGGTFNASGAVGWEWFELQTVQGVTIIGWRGKGPPSGEMYGGDPNAGCNSCHKLAASNDYVLSPAFRLAGASDAGTDLASAGDGGAGNNQEAGADAGVENDATTTD